MSARRLDGQAFVPKQRRLKRRRSKRLCTPVYLWKMGELAQTRTGEDLRIDCFYVCCGGAEAGFGYSCVGCLTSGVEARKGFNMSTSKICVLCNGDCSNKPRVKDGSGRYACKTCQAEADAKARVAGALVAGSVAPPKVVVMREASRAGAGVGSGGRASQQGGGSAVPARGGHATAVAEVESDAIDLSGVVAAERSAMAGIAEGIACRGCGVSVPAGARICTGCGYDFVNKRKPGKIKVVNAEELALAPNNKWKKGNNSMFVRVVSGSGVAMAGAVLLALGLIVGWNSPEIRQITLVLAFAYGIVYTVLIVLTPIQEGSPIWSAVAISQFFIPFTGLAMIYYAFVVTERQSLRWWWIGGVIAQVIITAAIARGLTTNKEVDLLPAGEAESSASFALSPAVASVV